MDETSTVIDPSVDPYGDLAAALASYSEFNDVDESDVLDREIDLDDPMLLSAISPSYADVRAEHGTSAFADAARLVSRQTALMWAHAAEVIRNAEDSPEVYLRADVRVTTAEAREYSVRAAVADLAVQTAMSEAVVRTIAEHARRLIAAGPEFWAAFRAGRISPANARIAADTLGNLPVEQWTAFGAEAARPASTMAPARFHRAAHAIRDRLHRVTIAERHAAAATRRRVVLEHDLDGMSWLSLHLPSAVATEAHGEIETRARQLASLPGETRTLDQLRADVAADLLTRTHPITGNGERGTSGANLTVTVSAETLDGGDAPGILAGVGAIPATTARELAGRASSFTAAITHRETGAILNLDPDRYRLSEALKRLIRVRDRCCTFPGCTRDGELCDIDHITERQYGGKTVPGNLHCLCRNHHRLKSLTRWRPIRDDDTGTTQWTSPTGAVTDSDPPPF